MLTMLVLFQTAILYVCMSFLYLIASSLVVHMVHAEVFSWVPKWSKDQLLVTGVSKTIFISLQTDQGHGDIATLLIIIIMYLMKNIMCMVNYRLNTTNILYKVVPLSMLKGHIASGKLQREVSQTIHIFLSQNPRSRYSINSPLQG